jgi:hypothetical protein
LTSNGIHAYTPEILAKVKALFIERRPRELDENMEEGASPSPTPLAHASNSSLATNSNSPVDVEVPVDVLEKVLLECPAGLAPGPSGLRTDHIRQALSLNDAMKGRLLTSLTRITQRLVSGQCPTDIRKYLCGGRIVPLKKPDGGVRPIVVGELLKLVASLVHVNLFDAEFYDVFRNSQVAMLSRGLDAAVTTAKSWASLVSNHHQLILFKVDMTNAYNTLSRNVLIHQAKDVDRDAAAWVDWTLSENSFRGNLSFW